MAGCSAQHTGAAVLPAPGELLWLCRHGRAPGCHWDAAAASAAALRGCGGAERLGAAPGSTPQPVGALRGSGSASQGPNARGPAGKQTKRSVMKRNSWQESKEPLMKASVRRSAAPHGAQAMPCPPPPPPAHTNRAKVARERTRPSTQPAPLHASLVAAPAGTARPRRALAGPFEAEPEPPHGPAAAALGPAGAGVGAALAGAGRGGAGRRYGPSLSSGRVGRGRGVRLRPGTPPGSGARNGFPPRAPPRAGPAGPGRAGRG